MRYLAALVMIFVSSLAMADLRVGIASKILPYQETYYVLKCEPGMRCITAAMVDRAVYVEDLRTQRIIKGVLRPTDATDTLIDYCTLSIRMKLEYRRCTFQAITEGPKS